MHVCLWASVYMCACGVYTSVCLTVKPSSQYNSCVALRPEVNVKYGRKH